MPAFELILLGGTEAMLPSIRLPFGDHVMWCSDDLVPGSRPSAAPDQVTRYASPVWSMCQILHAMRRMTATIAVFDPRRFRSLR